VFSVTPPAALYPRERISGTHWTGSWVGLRAGLDTEARGKILRLCQGSNRDQQVVQSVVRHYTGSFRFSFKHYSKRQRNTIFGVRRLLVFICNKKQLHPIGFNKEHFTALLSILSMKPFVLIFCKSISRQHSSGIFIAFFPHGFSYRSIACNHRDRLQSDREAYSLLRTRL
jgi:hypothetical protein